MGVGAEEEEVVLQKREKKKRNKKNEDGLLGAKTVYGKTIVDESKDNGIVLRKSRNKAKEKVEKEKKDGGSTDMNFWFTEEDFVNDEDQTQSKNEKKRKLERREKKKHKYDGCYNTIEDEEATNVKGSKKSLDVNMNDKELKNEVVMELLKDKNKRKVKRNKNKEDISSPSVEVLIDKEKGDNKETKELEHFNGEVISDIKEWGEREKQKKKKQKKEKKIEEKEVGANKETNRLERCEAEVISDTKERKVNVKEKKKKVKNEIKVKERSNVEDSNMKCSDKVATKGKTNIASGQELRKEKDHVDVGGEKNVRNKGKSNRKKEKDDKESDSRDIPTKKSIGVGQTLLDHEEVAHNDGHFGSVKNKKRYREEVFDVKMEKKKKKKKKTMEGVDTGDPKTENRGGSTNDSSKNSEHKKPSKRVTFSDHVEVFPLSDDTDVEEVNGEENLVRGKRFSRKEDEIIKDAVFNYIETHGLGENGLDMVMQCKQYPRLRQCWRQIGAALPWRPYSAVYYRAHILFERAEERGWTEEEKTLIIKFHGKHGSNWKDLAKALGKNRVHVKDTWRRIKFPNLKRGHWSQDEYQSLFDSVNMDLRMKAYEEKKSKHGMLRDNISWTAISDKMATRTDMSCCSKWYDQLTSPMVKAGDWVDADDYRLLDELLRLDACCVEDVDWDNLLEHRSGDICLKRWKQMARHIGENGIQSFAEQVEVLAKRYCPELLDTREAFDSRLHVP